MSARTLLLVILAMLAFAGNSILCRLALKETTLDAGSFTSIRLLAGAAMLCLLLLQRRGKGAHRPRGSWRSSLALFIYAVAFSFAYVELDAGTGALLLFGAVQLSMLAWGLLRGERLAPLATAGLALALAGLVALLLPGASAPAPAPAALMLLAGVAWGAYSLLGRGSADALADTAGNFVRALPLGLLLGLVGLGHAHGDLAGVLYAVLSGAVASGIGYALWYSVLPRLGALQAASIQLSVPVIAVIAGVVLLGEPASLRLLLACAAVLGGISLVLRSKGRRTSPEPVAR